MKNDKSIQEEGEQEKVEITEDDFSDICDESGNDSLKEYTKKYTKEQKEFQEFTKKISQAS